MLTNKPQPINLKEFIARVKKDLLEDTDKTSPLVLISKVDLEISFTVERNMNGSIDFQVIQSGVDKTMSEVQTVKITLEPLLTVEEMRKNISPQQKKKAGAALTREYSSERESKQ